MIYRCPITYELTENRYSQKGLKLLSRQLNFLNDFPYTAQEQVEMAAIYETKLSVQGVQPKLSTRLNVKEQVFEVVERGGKYIFKPPHNIHAEVPQNEDLTMRLADTVGIEIPLHGMIYNIDGSLTYFVKRFDRIQSKQIGVEDFSQILGCSRDTKYDSSMEKVISVINQYCTFPAVEKQKLFRLTIFNYLIGNEDMHLKNFSLLTTNDQTTLSPAYDLLNTTIIMKSKEEIDLPLNGKKSNLKRTDFLEYFGKERLSLPENILIKELEAFKRVLPTWKELISNSFLSPTKQDMYQLIIQMRWKKLESD